MDPAPIPGTSKQHRTDNYRYDVALSFSGKDRPTARTLAFALKTKGIRVFYDEWAKADLLGKDLPTHLHSIYRHSARHCVILLSEAYRTSIWPRHELKSVLDRSVHEPGDYLLPLRLDSAEIPGIRDGIAYLDLRQVTVSEAASIIAEKIAQSTSPALPERMANEVTREESLRYVLDNVPGFVRQPSEQTAAISDPELVARILALRIDEDARIRARLAEDLCREVSFLNTTSTPYTCWLSSDRFFVSMLPGVVIGSQKTFEFRYFDGAPPVFGLSAEWTPATDNEQWGPTPHKVFHAHVKGVTADRSGCSMYRESSIYVLEKQGVRPGFPVTPFSNQFEPLCGWINQEPERGWFD